MQSYETVADAMTSGNIFTCKPDDTVDAGEGFWAGTVDAGEGFWAGTVDACEGVGARVVATRSTTVD
jgi:hypothetical protein